ncbi:hypothetical protein SAMN04487936_102433 [Halobacillus dabanensis]|uniref:Uncharacterized protein n=1 Tax=Halobacillus dabanensis TaxID=240302 RepID=A0A1I3RY00_HALDA|nr:hypothetical protein SAMN04487936_102433 [Halobacillus dabanensis]
MIPKKQEEIQEVAVPQHPSKKTKNKKMKPTPPNKKLNTGNKNVTGYAFISPFLIGFSL